MKIGDKSSAIVGKRILSGLIPFLGLIVVFLFFSIRLGNRFLSINNLLLIINQSIIYMIIGLGASFVVAHGNIDFSIGGVLGAAVALGMVLGTFAWKGTGSRAFATTAAICGCMIAGVILCSLTSVFHLVLRIPGFVASLSIMFLGRGLCQVMCATFGIKQAVFLNPLNTTSFYLISLVVTFLICGFLFEFTKLGKYNKAIGSNKKATELSGINVSKYKFLAYLTMGCCIGAAAFVYLVRVGAASALAGNSYEVDILIALVLGGLPLSGGSQVKIYSILTGALIFMMLKNGLTIMNVSAEYTNLIRGLIFLIVTLCSYNRKSSQFVL